jgi:hypothetical protein
MGLCPATRQALGQHDLAQPRWADHEQVVAAGSTYFQSAFVVFPPHDIGIIHIESGVLLENLANLRCVARLNRSETPQKAATLGARLSLQPLNPYPARLVTKSLLKGKHKVRQFKKQLREES